MSIRTTVRVLVAFATLCSTLLADAAAPESLPATSSAEAIQAEHLPITEVTVFKDGHAFVLREANFKTDGTVVVDELPAAVLGTFWPYATGKGMRLREVIAGKRQTTTSRPVVTIRDLLEANIGADATIHEIDGRDYTATILDVLNPNPKPPEQAKPGQIVPFGAPAAPTPPSDEAKEAKLVVLRVHEDTKVVPIDRIRDVSFRRDPKRVFEKKESRGVLTMMIDSVNAAPHQQAHIGLAYLQKGLRWIPSYKVDIDGKGTATINLQATLVNELADLKDVKVQLVVGVPTFAFKDQLDPMSLQEQAAQLGPHFRPDSQTAYAFSNAIMSQSATYVPPSAQQPSGPEQGAELSNAAQREDLFIFTLSNISLAKGERMVVPVAQYTVPYKDVYVLDLPFAPPAEVRREISDRRQLEAVRLMNEPKVMHKIRLTNKAGRVPTTAPAQDSLHGRGFGERETPCPFTTAPALVVQNGRALAQGMITYTAVGGTSDLDLTVAVNVRAKKSDVETKREPNATSWHGVPLARIDLAGTISITNNRSDPVDVEVVRHVLGQVDNAQQGGKADQTNAWEDAWELDAYPEWFRWYSWPWWFNSVNGVGRIRWDVHLAPGEKTELNYTWHYFWG